MLKGDAGIALSAAGGVARTGASRLLASRRAHASKEESRAAGSARPGSPATEVLTWYLVPDSKRALAACSSCGQALSPGDHSEFCE